MPMPKMVKEKEEGEAIKELEGGRKRGKNRDRWKKNEKSDCDIENVWNMNRLGKQGKNERQGA